jgi:hypothetical protein
MATVRAFDFERYAGGVCVVSCRERVTLACATEGEIDGQIAAVKENLDAVGQRMKTDLRKLKAQPLFGQE